jgi:hypothetical protein
MDAFLPAVDDGESGTKQKAQPGLSLFSFSTL